MYENIQWGYQKIRADSVISIPSLSDLFNSSFNISFYFVNENVGHDTGFSLANIGPLYETQMKSGSLSTWIRCYPGNGLWSVSKVQWRLVVVERNQKLPTATLCKVRHWNWYWTNLTEVAWQWLNLHGFVDTPIVYFHTLLYCFREEN